MRTQVKRNGVTVEYDVTAQFPAATDVPDTATAGLMKQAHGLLSVLNSYERSQFGLTDFEKARDAVLIDKLETLCWVLSPEPETEDE